MLVTGGFGLYLLLMLPALLLGLWAQARVRSSFNRYSRVASPGGISGAEVARRLLVANGLASVRVEQSHGFLSDHYDPLGRVLRLSPDVFQGRSVAAAGVAAHEAGHALQHQKGYAPLMLRSAIVPAVQFGSWLGPILFFTGLLLRGILGSLGQSMAWLGLILFGAVAVFSLITLPVEFDASRRARQQLVGVGILTPGELTGVNSVLNAAALTYVAAAVQAVSQVLYYGLLLAGGRRE